jgi:large subunit ribosomal protein L23
VFLPNFWLKLVRPKHKLPPNVVQFIVSIQMTKHDIRNYLEKIYKIPVVDVRTVVAMGMCNSYYTCVAFHRV